MTDKTLTRMTITILSVIFAIVCYTAHQHSTANAARTGEYYDGSGPCDGVLLPTESDFADSKTAGLNTENFEALSCILKVKHASDSRNTATWH
ncbi:hypothetical protein BCR37DRAFT_380153 [Protomyces lactucae-debilis]|uniref:Uncharacterized protein n=1 Tax=Protomyces lactucae-debilis TaxID=2754530 RepID=A0A1Y2FCK0_PROLT|nr:uncharacterized protein BCR37DRAFT_380153 [Protomyces lactucae-debilis]ORY81347.1 hypothetical protein BCR37DRAFT_380153 [Protomyces lactucae-debilis]